MKIDWNKFNDDMRQLLLNHEITFAALWIRDGDDLTVRGYAEDGEGAIFCTVFQKWVEKNMERMMGELEEDLDKLAKALNPPTLDISIRKGPQEGTGSITN